MKDIVLTWWNQHQVMERLAELQEPVAVSIERPLELPLAFDCIREVRVCKESVRFSLLSGLKNLERLSVFHTHANADAKLPESVKVFELRKPNLHRPMHDILPDGIEAICLDIGFDMDMSSSSDFSGGTEKVIALMGEESAQKHKDIYEDWAWEALMELEGECEKAECGDTPLFPPDHYEVEDYVDTYRKLFGDRIADRITHLAYAVFYC